jgi:hypothetical protein
MKKQKKIIHAIAILFLFLSNLISFNPQAAHAFSCGFPGTCTVNVAEETSNAMDKVMSRTEDIFTSAEDRYGFDKDTWRKAKRKVYAPRVEISFDNTNPKAGEKVTAHAIPEFFKNDPQNLYFNWYIIHTDDGTPQGATNTIENGKIEASKIMTRGDYDSSLDNANYSGSSDDPDSDGWPSIDDDSSYDESKSAAPYGGADGVGGITDSSDIHSSASEYCNSLADDESPSNNNCSYLSDSSYTSTLQYYTLDSSQTDYFCSQCRTYFNENSDLLPSSACTGSRNQCCYNAIPQANLECSSTTSVPDPITGEPTDVTTYYKCAYDSSSGYCGDTADYCGSDTTCQTSRSSCYDTFKTCNKNTVEDCIDDKVSQCEDDHTSTNDEIIYDVTRCYKHNFGTNTGATAFSNDDGSGIDYPVKCKHKWVDISDSYTSGSGKFPNGEEEKWKTDPRDPDTDGDGFNDEADVIGLGQEDFSWHYQEGDRIGVVVEGTSTLPTDEKNTYYKLMWGYMDVCDNSKTKLLADDECDSSSDYGYGFLATKSPSEEASEEKLQVSLNYSPDNPVADPTSDETMEDANEVSVTASLDNTDLKEENLYYSWYIQQKGSSDDSDWETVDLADNFDISTSSSGLGVSTFSFTPKKDFLKDKSADIVNLKVVAAVSRTSAPSTYETDTLGRTTPRKGYASVEVPINKNGVYIKLYKVDINDDGKATLGDEICNEDPYKTYCPAVQNQMMAAKISGSSSKYTSGNISWSLDGELLSQPLDFTVFEDWTSTTDATIFFPIAKSAKETEEISVTATPKDKLQAVTASRSISVIDPVVSIESSDENTSWPKTYAVESETTEDTTDTIKSDSVYEAYANSDLSYNLNFIPDYLFDGTSGVSIDWKINGTSIQDEGFDALNLGLSNLETPDDNQIIYFTTGETEGAYYTLGADFKKYWSAEEKDVLYSAWGLQPETLEGNTSIDIETVYATEGEETTNLTSPRQILAAIGTHLPEYVMYILRLALTILVMFFFSVFFYSLTQRISLYEEK